jgi:hypothetical protein
MNKDRSCQGIADTIKKSQFDIANWTSIYGTLKKQLSLSQLIANRGLSSSYLDNLKKPRYKQVLTRMKPILFCLVLRDKNIQ